LGVYKHVDTDYEVEAVSAGTTSFTLTLTTNVTDIEVDDVIGLHSFSNYVEYIAEDSIAASTTEKFDLDGFYVVSAVDKNVITLLTPTVQTEITKCVGSITCFLKVRAANISSANTILQQNLDTNDYLWIDNVSGLGKWSVLKNENLFTEQLRLTKPSTSSDVSFGTAMSVDDRNTTLIVGAPDQGDGKVYVYSRATDSINFVQTQVIEPFKFGNDLEQFGAAVAVSPDGAYVIVGSPNASNVKTKYAGTFVPGSDYGKGSIVAKDQQLWKSLVDIEGEEASIQFNSFNSITYIVDVLI